MNNRFLGNATCLTKYDLLITLAKLFNLPTWYVTMLTESETRNKGDRNATNYRLGSQNTELLESLKGIFYGDDGIINDIGDLFKKQEVNNKLVTFRNNQKAGHFRIGNINYFSHNDRAHYFEGLATLIDEALTQIIFLDPDTGVMPSCKKLAAGKGKSFIRSSEIKELIDAISDESIIMINQQLTDYQYTHEARVKDLQNDLQPNVLLLVDEVIQSGLYFITKSQSNYDLLLTHLWDYMTQYRFIKSSERVILFCGSEEGVVTRPLGISTQSAKKKMADQNQIVEE